MIYLDSLSKIKHNINTFNNVVKSENSNFPALSRAATPVSGPTAPVLGRDKEIQDLRLNLRNPEKANVIVLADPGTGKSAVVQGLAFDNNSSQYLTVSVDVERLAQDPNADKDAEMANGLLDLVEETKEYSKLYNVIVILFIDEFHRIAMISPSAVESLKPILEKSANFGFRVIAATTFEEYDQWIAVNRALDQRLLRMDLPELPKDAVINILKSRVAHYGLSDQADEEVYGEIFDTASQILISNSQPRASIDILLNMVGNITTTEYMKDGKLLREYATPEELNINSDYSLSRPMLNRVIQRSYGIDIDNKIDVKTLRPLLNSRIFNQSQAINTFMSRLEMSLAGFNDPTRPKISILSTGPTGSGKALPDTTPVPAPIKGFINHGDLVVGDVIFAKDGKPTTVTGVYPQGDKQVYRFTFEDGRVMDSADEHLWSACVDGEWGTHNSKDLLELKKSSIIFIPSGGAVEREVIDYILDPYLVGYLAGSVNSKIKLSEVSDVVKDMLITFNPDGVKGDYFELNAATYQEVLGQSFPDAYLIGSIDQRWSLLQGLCDSKGFFDDSNNLKLKTTTRELNKIAQQIMWSLGISSKVNINNGYELKVEVSQFEKHKFFKHSDTYTNVFDGLVLTDDTDYSILGVHKIELLPEMVPMTCITVDNDEHLYQAGVEHIVTHNTEIAKVIAEALHVPLKRFDMSRYPNPEDAVQFADELARAAWSAPNAYILIDEAEKSTKQCMNILLQVLDDARLTASNNANRVISFTGNIINLTTNLGSEISQHDQRFGDANADVNIEDIYKSLSDSDEFETAVLGRLDAIAPFKALPRNALGLIGDKELMYNISIAETANRQIFVSPDILPYIVIDRTSNDSERGGARDVKRNIKNVVIQALASYMAEGRPEVPLILRLDNTPRFRDQSVGDPMNAGVMVEECYTTETVNGWLSQLSAKVNAPLRNDGLYIPVSMHPQEFMRAVVELYKTGIYAFKSTIDIETTVVIDSSINIDVQDVGALLGNNYAG